jgi:predicted patatin/cPLA2 family phospholipase
MRSIFSAGVLDRFLDRRFNPFNNCIGVSAGACNLVSYLAGEQGKNRDIFLHVAESRAFINPLRFLRGGHLLDMQWLFESVIAHQIAPSALSKHNTPLLIGMTEVATGEAIFSLATPDNLIKLLMASMSLPVLYRDFPLVQGRAMVDGGLADAIPVQKAIDSGASRIMVVRSRHADYQKRDTLFHRYIRWRLRDHQQLGAVLEKRVEKHRKATALLRSPPPGIDIVDACPPADFSMGRFGQRHQQLLHGYRAGIEAADRAIEQWNNLSKQKAKVE